MSHDIEIENGFFITRHATQELLRRTLTVSPSVTYGMLGGQPGLVEAVHPCNQGSSTTCTRLLESENMQMIALYISAASREESVGIVRKRLMQMLSQGDADIFARLHVFPLLIVRLDTKGRMEAVLFTHTVTDDEVELPLILQEDQTIPPAA